MTTLFDDLNEPVEPKPIEPKESIHAALDAAHVFVARVREAADFAQASTEWKEGKVALAIYLASEAFDVSTGDISRRLTARTATKRIYKRGAQRQ